MINIAARATRGIKLPDRKQTREAIVKEFKNQMKRLKDRLSVRPSWNIRHVLYSRQTRLEQILYWGYMFDM